MRLVWVLTNVLSNDPCSSNRLSLNSQRSMPAIDGMGDDARLDMSSFRVAEFSDVLDWRPMLFQDPVIAQRACALCGVLYKKAVRLPCAHTLCTKCHAQCADKGAACPVDQEPFCEEDLEKLELSAEYIWKRKVSCPNPLMEVLCHVCQTVPQTQLWYTLLPNVIFA